MDQSDSAYACIFRSMDYIDLADSILRADIYHNIAAMYEQKGDTENARKYLEKWKNDKSASSYKGYETMARLLEAQGHYQEAIETARKCLTEKDPLMRSHSMEMLSKLYEKIGDKSAALDMKRQKDAFTDSVMKANHSLEIADWQQKYDEERSEKRVHHRMMEMMCVIVIAVVLLVIGIWWHRRRIHKMGFQLNENARRITESQTEIERLQQSGEASEQTIAELNRQIESSRERISNKLLIGTRAFVKLQEKECISNMSADERHCLLDYFAQLRPKRWQVWERTYTSLTPAQYVFLILQDDLHYDDDTIAQMLDVKPASLRTLRSRIKGRER
jgi:tetratricopeptide (TPR) repeat protein